MRLRLLINYGGLCDANCGFSPGNEKVALKHFHKALKCACRAAYANSLGTASAQDAPDVRFLGTTNIDEKQLEIGSLGAA